MKISEKEISCINCNSERVIRHGKTSVGNLRYRCLDCNKTWVLNKTNIQKPDISEIVEIYLEGSSYRELVKYYPSSPLRINQKIREYLQGIPSWEEYLDSLVVNHDFKVIFLVGKTFSSSTAQPGRNQLYLAMAVDAMSSMVIGYEIGLEENKYLWQLLLDRMNCRGVRSGIFMTNGTDHVDDAVKTIFPTSRICIYYQKINRDQELSCCLARLPVNTKLINDSVAAYEELNNQSLNQMLLKNYSKTLKDFVHENPGAFSDRLRERIDNSSNIRIEGLSKAFQNRFEKFHMLKDDPLPLINGWLSKYMISTLDYGFSRLSLYLQVPIKLSFAEFSMNMFPQPIIYDEKDIKLQSFAIEIAARALQLPTFFSECEMQADHCKLFGL